MNQIQIFQFEKQNIRTKLDENGNPWWVAKDICLALGLKKPSNSFRKVEPNDMADALLEGNSQRRSVKIVNESGLYALIFQSQTPAAKRFNKWVTSEILPSIRKTGYYSVPTKPEIKQHEAIADFKGLVEVAELFGLNKNQALLAANQAILKQTGFDFQATLQIELKTEIQIRYYTPTDLGKRINLSAIKFNKLLRDKGFQIFINETWNPTPMGKSYSVLLDVGKKHSNGTPIQQLKWAETILEVL